MKIKFFAIPARDSQTDEAALNAFLATHRISHVEKEFVADGEASFWAISVTWVPAEAGASEALARKAQKVDYKAVLNAAEFVLYDRLRHLRKRLAEQEGLPVFAVFSNEQLAEMVVQRVCSLQALGAIEGIGEARVKRYGEAFLTPLREVVPRLGQKVLGQQPLAGEVTHAPAHAD